MDLVNPNQGTVIGVLLIVGYSSIYAEHDDKRNTYSGYTIHYPDDYDLIVAEIYASQ